MIVQNIEYQTGLNISAAIQEISILVDQLKENSDNILIQTEISDDNITQNKIKHAKNNKKEGKSSGPDEIQIEVIKRCNIDDIIISFANKLLEKGLKPEQWSDIDMIPITKSGDLSQPMNYRGISLISVTAKLVNKMILNRIQIKIDNKLRSNQNGFRPGCSTSNILQYI